MILDSPCSCARTSGIHMFMLTCEDVHLCGARKHASKVIQCVKDVDLNSANPLN